jgi:hypothetical protein
MIREHVWVADKCIVCGALAWARIRAEAVMLGKGDPGPTDERQCLERDDFQRDLCPAPARRVPACEDNGIAGRIAELEAEKEAAWNAEPEPTK